MNSSVAIATMPSPPRVLLRDPTGGARVVWIEPAIDAVPRRRGWAEIGSRAFGALCSVPFFALLLAGFLIPLLCVAAFSLMPPRTFSLMSAPTLANFRVIVEQGYLASLGKSTAIALATVGILLIVCYPLAFAMAKVFRRGAIVVTYAIASSLFVSENIRLFGWVIGLMRGGVLGGLMKSIGLETGSWLYNVPVIVFGTVYVYLPFMLFPLTLGLQMVPEQVREAAFDLGASRWQVFRMIDVPLSMPGIVIGSVLVFVLSLGAIAEAKILGGQKIVTIAAEIESAFTFGQNWPLGSAIATMLIGITMVLVFSLLRKIDLEKFIGRKPEAES